MITTLLRNALADARLFEDTAILLLVAGQPPADASEYAYLPPGHWGDLEHRVLFDAADRLAEFSDFHRFAAYAEPVDVPEAAIAVGLRHEAQHALQFNQYGPNLFNLESILRRAMRRADRMGDYTAIPIERDANRAAGRYARNNYGNHVETLATDDGFRHFVDEPAPVHDLLDETVAMIGDYVEDSEIDDQDDERRPFGVVVPELAASVRQWVPIDPRYLVRRPEGQGLVVDVEL